MSSIYGVLKHSLTSRYTIVVFCVIIIIQCLLPFANMNEYYFACLKKIILSNAGLMRLLEIARKLDLPNWYIGAGTVRNIVWDVLHGYEPQMSSDVDLVYYSDLKIHSNMDKVYEAALNDETHGFMWDVNNQFYVDTWYEEYTGIPLAKLKSCEEGISIWPDTSTAIGVRLDEFNNIIIFAPFGLEDLFELKVRWNNKIVSYDIFSQRIKNKRFIERWPKLNIIS